MSFLTIDRFTRTTSPGLGTSDDGYTYVFKFGSNTLASTDGANAVFTSAGSAVGEDAILNYAVPVNNYEVLISFESQHIGDLAPHVILRSTSNVLNRYDLGMDYSASNNWAIHRYINDSPTELVTSPNPPTPNPANDEKWWLRARATGTGAVVNLLLKAWKDGTPEPVSWTLTFDDTSASRLTAAGYTGFGFASSSASNLELLKIHEFSVADTVPAFLFSSASATTFAFNWFQTFTAPTPSGGGASSGTAALTRTIARIGSSGGVSGGTAPTFYVPVLRIFVYNGSSGGLATGTAAIATTRASFPAGGGVASGFGTIARARVFVPSGGISISATATASTTTSAPGGVRFDFVSSAISATFLFAAATQFLRPTSDVTVGAWRTNTGSGVGLFSAVDEVSADDTDFIRSEVAPVLSAVRLRLNTPSVIPTASGPFNIRLNLGKHGGGTVDVALRLLQGATVIFSKTYAAISAGVTSIVETLSSSQVALIDPSYANIDLEWTATQVGYLVRTPFAYAPVGGGGVSSGTSSHSRTRVVFAVGGGVPSGIAPHSRIKIGVAPSGGGASGGAAQTSYVRSPTGVLFDADFTLGAMPSNVTVSRNSAAWYVDSTGKVNSVPAHTGRLDYDPIPTSLKPLGLLIEGQATNLLTANDALDTWTLNNTTVASAAGPSPDGLNLAFKINETAGSGGSVLTTDTYTRTTTGGLGTSDGGFAYTLKFGDTVPWSTNGSQLVYTGQTAAVARAARLNYTPPSADYEILFPWYSDSVGNVTMKGVLRADTNVTTQYELGMDYNLSNEWGIYKRVADTLTALVTTTNPPAKNPINNERWWIRARVEGQNPVNLSLRFWKDGTTEPTTWDLTFADTAANRILSGSPGITGVSTSAMTTAHCFLDSFQVLSIGTVADYSIRRDTTKAASSLAYSVDFYVRNAERTLAAVWVGDTTVTNAVRATFNLTSKSVQQTTLGTGWSFSSGKLTDVGNGWFRGELHVTSDTGTTISIRLGTAVADNSTSHVGVLGNGVYFWRPGLVQASLPASSVIFTSGSQVTRLADDVTTPLSAVPGFSASTGSWVLIGKSGPTDAEQEQTFARIEDTTSGANLYTVVRSTDGVVRFISSSGGVQQASLALGSLATNTDYSVAAAWGGGALRATLNGQPIVGATGLTPPVGLATIRYGAKLVGPLYGYNHFRHAKIWANMLSDSQLFTEVGGAVTPPPSTVHYPAEVKPLTWQAMTSRPRPAYRVVDTDPDTNTRVERISDYGAFGVTFPNPNALKQGYPKYQWWNSDGSLLMLSKNFPGFLLDGNTYAFIKRVDQSSYFTWSNTNPDYGYGTQSPTSLVRFNVQTNSATLVRNFGAGYSDLSIGGAEGTLSNDDTFIPLMGASATFVDLICYNTVNDTFTSRRFTGASIDWFGMSQSGQYCIAQFISTTASPDGTTGTFAFDRNWNFLRKLGDNVNHLDIGYNIAGDEVMCGAGPGMGFRTVRIVDGQEVVQVPENPFSTGDVHFSCKALNRPGYCYISDFATGNSNYVNTSNWNKVIAVKLDGTGTCEVYCRSHHADLGATGTDRNYERSVMASPSRDGSRVLYCSDWENNTTSAEIHAYVAWAP